MKFQHHYDYLDKIAFIFSEKLKQKTGFKEDLSGFISWRGDTARGYQYDNEETIVEYRKSLIYLLTFAKPYSEIQGRKKEVIHQLYVDLLPLILECEAEIEQTPKTPD